MLELSSIKTKKDNIKKLVKKLVSAGSTHRKRLKNINLRISVSGIRGKSSSVRWLHNEFRNRGYNTYSKITGEKPISLYNEKEKPIPRSGDVKLYENENELAKYHPIDVAIFENQAITEYTTRLFNEKFVKPHIVFLTNVREDHLSTLGKNRRLIARSFARSIPKNTKVINGERDPRLRKFINERVKKKKGEVKNVSIPSKYSSIPGCECVFGVNTILKETDEPPVSKNKIKLYLQKMKPKWIEIPRGRIFNGSNINDVQSTELIRRYLLDEKDETVLPLMFIRADRRGRTVSFLRYFEELYEKEAINKVHVLGHSLSLFENRASFEVEKHNYKTETPSSLLNSLLKENLPVFIVGNTVNDFMWELDDIIKKRRIQNKNKYKTKMK